MEEQANGRQADQGSDAEVSEMRQQLLLLEQQQVQAMDASQRVMTWRKDCWKSRTSRQEP
eukprot:12908679-Prorocentrum_lima.AAC.1